MSTCIIKFPLDEETGYPGLIPKEWPGDPRKLYAMARWLKKLLDSGEYTLEQNGDNAFIIIEDNGEFKISAPAFATETALYVLADLLGGMGDYIWKLLFKGIHMSALANQPRIALPGTPGIAG